MNLRLTDTTAADDSGGSVWGLDGNLFMPVVASAAVSVGVLLLLFAVLHVYWLISALIGAVPFCGTLIRSYRTAIRFSPQQILP